MELQKILAFCLASSNESKPFSELSAILDRTPLNEKNNVQCQRESICLKITVAGEELSLLSLSINVGDSMPVTNFSRTLIASGRVSNKVLSKIGEPEERTQCAPWFTFKKH